MLGGQFLCLWYDIEEVVAPEREVVAVASDQILDNSSAKKKQNWTQASVDLQMRQVNLEGNDVANVNRIQHLWNPFIMLFEFSSQICKKLRIK